MFSFYVPYPLLSILTVQLGPEYQSYAEKEYHQCNQLKHVSYVVMICDISLFESPLRVRLLVWHKTEQSQGGEYQI